MSTSRQNKTGEMLAQIPKNEGVRSAVTSCYHHGNLSGKKIFAGRIAAYTQDSIPTTDTATFTAVINAGDHRIIVVNSLLNSEHRRGLHL